MQHWQEDKQAWIESTRPLEHEPKQTESIYVSVVTGLTGFSCTLAAILVMAML